MNRYKAFRIQYLESRIHGVESRIQDFLRFPHFGKNSCKQNEQWTLPHEIVITFPQLFFSWVWCNFKAFYPFKDFSIWPNTEKLNPKNLCSLGTHGCRIEFDTHLRQRSATKGFIFQQLRCHCNPDRSKFSSLFNTYWQLWWKTAPQTKLNSNKSVCETAPKSLFWAITCVPGFEYTPWLACWKSHCGFANQNEGKFETHFQNREIVAASLLPW